MMLHLTKQSSAYLENVWAWTADHDLDSGPDQTQIDIYVARGMSNDGELPSTLHIWDLSDIIMHRNFD